MVCDHWPAEAVEVALGMPRGWGIELLKLSFVNGGQLLLTPARVIVVPFTSPFNISIEGALEIYSNATV